MLTTTLVVGLAAAGLTQVVRALSPLDLLVRKPVSCDLCMSWWSALLVVGALWPLPWREAAVVVLGAVAVSLLVLKLLTLLRGATPE